MGKPTGFLDYPREKARERDLSTRLKDWGEYQLPQSEENLKTQGARCMDCGTPFCHSGIELNGSASGCPLYNLIPEWNHLVYQGKWKDALDRLLKTNNFPEFTGRVCPAPCEGACVAAIPDDAVAIKSIEKEIIDRGFAEGWMTPQPPKNRTGKKIAIVGSGPAGLAAADQLNKAGHSVTVYERDDRIGGLLMYGIPNMKLDKELVERRVKLLADEGVTFVTNTEIGKDVTQAELRDEHDAVILCTGAQKHRDLPIEGRKLGGIHYAMDYLKQNTKSLLDSELQDKKYVSAEGKNVIVIGGGDTGADCVATALRHGCKSVHQFGKHPQLTADRMIDNPWPEFPKVFTLDYAYEEAQAEYGEDPRQYSIMTKKFVGDESGQVKELHTVTIEKHVDKRGNVFMKELPGTEQVWPVELVLIAIGFTGPEEGVLEHFEVDQDNRKRAKAEFEDYRTNVDGVFAAGDVRRGQSLIVWAINEGRGVARETDRYLMNKTVMP